MPPVSILYFFYYTMKRILVVFIGLFIVCFFLPSKVKAVEFPVPVPPELMISYPPVSDCSVTPVANDCLGGGFTHPVMIPLLNTASWNSGVYEEEGYALFMLPAGLVESSFIPQTVRGVAMLSYDGYSYPTRHKLGLGVLWRETSSRQYYSIPYTVGYYLNSTGSWIGGSIPDTYTATLNPTKHITSQIWSSLPVWGYSSNGAVNNGNVFYGEITGVNFFIMEANISHSTIPIGGTYTPPDPPPPIGYIDEISGDWGTWDFFRDGINFLIRGLNGIISGLNTMLLWISDFFTPIFQWFADKIRDLFLPSEGFIEGLQDEIDEAMNEKISITGFKTLVNDFKAGISTNSTEVPTVLTGTVMGQQVTLVDYSLIYEHINIIRGTIQAVFAILIIVVVVPNLWNRFSQV